jgi:hypothetical protein
MITVLVELSSILEDYSWTTKDLVDEEEIESYGGSRRINERS